MNKILDQSEIDSMFAAAHAADDQDASLAAPRPLEHYKFGRSGQITREQMQGISAVNDLFAHNLTHSLGAWLRSRFEVALVSAEQMTWSDFTSLIPEPAYLCSAALAPLDALAALQLDLTLAPAIVDLLLGGTGRPGFLREPTEIEDSILLSVFEILLRELNAAWRPVGLSFTFGKREPDTQINGVMTATERILCVSFEVRMSEVQGSLNLCLPSVVLNTLLRRSTCDRQRRRSAETRARLGHLLMEAGFASSLQFPPMGINARALAELAPGKVLALPLARQSSAELRIGGQAFYQAMPVRLGGNRGAQLKTLNAMQHEGQ